jgi:hypothetical protein
VLHSDSDNLGSIRLWPSLVASSPLLVHPPAFEDFFFTSAMTDVTSTCTRLNYPGCCCTCTCAASQAHHLACK